MRNGYCLSKLVQSYTRRCDNDDMSFHLAVMTEVEMKTVITLFRLEQDWYLAPIRGRSIALWIVCIKYLVSVRVLMLYQGACQSIKRQCVMDYKKF